MKLTDQKSAFNGEPRLYQIVARRIARMIEENRSDPSWRVPTERELASLLDVSRPVIREAVIALEVTGLVAVKGRAGIVLLPRAEDRVADDDSKDPSQTDKGVALSEPLSFDQLIEARLAIEPAIAGIAAAQADKSAIEAMRGLVDQMPTSDAESFDQLSFSLQQKLAAACGNPALVCLSRNVQEMWTQALEGSDALEALYGPEQRPRWIGDHYAILSAVQMSQPSAAQASVRRYLENLRQVMESIASSQAEEDIPDPNAPATRLATGSDGG